MLGKARTTLGALSPDELKQLQKDIADLLALYEGGGATTGGGMLEVKSIPRKQWVKNKDGSIYIDPETNAPVVETYYFGPYLYIRQYTVDERGKRRLRTVGYYGRAGAEAVSRGLGDELLRLHNAGGEAAVEDFLIAQGITEPLPNRWRGKPPATEPPHPIPGLTISADELEQHVIFQAFLAAAPVEAIRLLVALRDYEHDLKEYRFANEQKYGFRLPMEEIIRRRQHERLYKSGGRQRFRIRVIRERKHRG